MSRIIRGEDKENGAAAQDKVSDRVLNHYEYDAFGNTISCGERVANRFRYQSGSKADTKPYTNSRPSFRKGVVEEVWENAKGPDGLVRDPNTGEVINWTPGESRKGVWDMGHLPEAKYSEMHEAYMNGELTTKEFVDWYNDPANYRPELPSNIVVISMNKGESNGYKFSSKMKSMMSLFPAIMKVTRKKYIKVNHYYFIHYPIMIQKVVI